jgi:ubiquinone/menaquinone biosynthesis C-methylase UbiE
MFLTMTIPQPVGQDRSSREKHEYDEGAVHENSDRLHRRFSHVFACPNTMRAERFFAHHIAKAAPGARILDYGCYDGWLYPTLAPHRPSAIIGIDISDKGITAARAKYGQHATFLVMDAHQLDFPDNHFDLVVGRAILHHLHFDTAIREIHRVLKPGGRCLVYEPILGNPMAELFRRLTPSARNADERPLSPRQIQWANTIFAQAEFQYVNLMSTPLAMLTSLLCTSPDNLLLRGADAFDHVLDRTWLRHWMRQAVLCWHK